MAIWTPSQKSRTKKLKEEGCTRIYEVEVPADKIQEAVHNKLLRIQLSARIEGYRAGRAPLDLVKSRYREAATSEALQDLIQDAVSDAVKELKLRPVTLPSVANVQLSPDGPLKFEMHVEVAPTFEPKGYKGIQISQNEYTVADKDVDERLKQLQESNARLEKAEAEKVGKDHYVVMDYQILRDGKPLEGGTGKQELVDMSSDQTIEGLTQGLLEAKRQETRDVEVKLEGKPAVCKATVHEIKVKVLPKLDDDFAKDMGLESLDALKGDLRKIIEGENQTKTTREVNEQLEQSLLKSNPFEPPKALTEHQLEHVMDRYRMRLVGPDREIPEKQAAEIREKLAPQVADQVRLQFILAEVARKENIEATEEDFQQELEKSLGRASDDKGRKETREFFQKSKEDIRALIRERKVMELIRGAAKVKPANV
jgi:trigger factor